MISAESLTTVRATASVVAGALDDITPKFYRSLFTAHPELGRNLFNRSNQANGDQARALAASIVAFAELLLEDNGDRYGVVLDRVAHKHASLGVVADQYPVVYEHLFSAIADSLGEAATPAVVQAWTELYWLMAHELITRERELYTSAGVAAGDIWRQARVTARSLESADVVSLELAPLNGKFPDFLPGQYISVQVQLADGARQSRQYSLAHSSSQGSWRIAVKRLPGDGAIPAGEVSNFIYENVFEGDELRISIPAGELTLDESGRPLLLISAGIGCTPMLGMLHHLVAEQSTRDIRVLHADRAMSSHPYRHELTSLVDRLPNARLHSWYTTLQKDRVGATAGRMILGEQIAVDQQSVAFICGPRPFIRHVADALALKGVAAEDIRYELFGPPLLAKL
ncbi:hemin transporter [Mycobacterium sp. CBMA271]|uniref:globin domain-containing protein n=1 Tax=unclassified Mycobacteroides TaxID=2618759 RepID=UPI0012DEE791|nr:MULTISPECIES: globin domain-containing protein [unclassified Mycobacteroides]MUM18889.1 hemin transporter [Mycobacteroides sp. CBMA 326]MUM23171.1 hemin transporter [Mycobacteroides sp. CBMA 271]